MRKYIMSAVCGILVLFSDNAGSTVYTYCTHRGQTKEKYVPRRNIMAQIKKSLHRRQTVQTQKKSFQLLLYPKIPQMSIPRVGYRIDKDD